MPDLAALPDSGHLMLLMAILPMMLIGTILVVSWLDSRGLLGHHQRRVSFHVPLSAIAAGFSLAAAAVHIPALSNVSADGMGGVLLLAVVCFQIGWCLVHLLLRNAASATVGMIGTGTIVAGWLVAHIVAPGKDQLSVTLSDLFGVGFEVALILALVPQVTPSLAERLAQRQMKLQRAVVLSGFCLSVTVLFTSVALAG